MQEIQGGAATIHEGLIHISEDVIVELTRKTIQGIPNIQLAGTRLAAKFGLGRKAGDGIRVSVQDPEHGRNHERENYDNDDFDNEDDAENENVPLIMIDIYVVVRYGKRIPDLAWDVQEKVKNNLERYTGYIVKAVNINVQGIYTDEPIQLQLEQSEQSDSGSEGTQPEVLESADSDEFSVALEDQDHANQHEELTEQEQQGGDS